MEPRTYVVGLPVILTVSDDGRVVFEVDFSEAIKGMQEDFWTAEQPIDEAVFAADASSIERAIHGFGTISHANNPA